MSKTLPYLIAFLCLSFPLRAGYFDRHAEGWYWYEALELPHKEEPVKKQEKKPEKTVKVVAPPTPTEIIASFKRELERRRDRALVYPTLENVKAYQEFQQVMMVRAELFGQRWQEVVFTHPQLDYTVKHPISQVGRHLYNDRQRKQVEDKIRGLAKTHGLFFFFKDECDYCHQFAPIVKAFSDKYGWAVLAISIDGSKLPEFPGSVADNGAIERLGVEVYPTLLAIEPKTGEVIPLSYGLSTQDQIETRVMVLTKGFRQ